MKKKPKKNGWANFKFYTLLLIISIFIASYLWLSFGEYDIFGGLRALSENEVFAPAAFILLFVVSSFFPLPMLTMGGAVFFGLFEAVIYSVIGNMINAIVIFFVTRWLGRDFIKKFEKKHKAVKKLDLQFKEKAFRDMILLRFFSIIPPELVNLSAGLSGIKFKDYFWGSLIGFIPASLAAVLVVKSKLSGNNTFFILSVIFFIIVLIIPIIYISAVRKFAHGKYQGARKFARGKYRKVRKLVRFKKNKKIK